MNSTFKIMKYSFMDMLRSKWSIIYILFFMASTFFLLYFSNNLSKAIISLMNVVLTIVPLISVMMGVVYYYNSLEFAELLLAQPLKRSSVFLGQYLGLALSLSLSFIIGLGVPFLVYGLLVSGEITDFLTVIMAGTFLTFIFIGIAYFATMINNDRIKGFGLAIFIWLFMAVIYDGLFLLIMIYFKDYPLEKLAVVLSLFNPIDLSRILIMLKLDIAALLGYTGAVFKNFFGTGFGLSFTTTVLFFWIFLPIGLMLNALRKKDF